jgi:hypothetical protein
MIDLSYRPRLVDLQPLPRSNAGLLPFEPERARTSDAGAFHGRTGYQIDFLTGFVVSFPDTTAIAEDVLPVPESDGSRLDYEHFSVVMSKSRRLALFTAVDIDGSTSGSVPRGGDPWAFDGRIPEEAQAGTSFMPRTTSIGITLCDAKIRTGVRPPASPTAIPSISPTAHHSSPSSTSAHGWASRTTSSPTRAGSASARPSSRAPASGRPIQSIAASRSRSPTGRSWRSSITMVVHRPPRI